LQDAQLLGHAAPEVAVVGGAPAGGQNPAIRMGLQQLADRLHTRLGVAQVIQPELEKTLSFLPLSPRRCKKLADVRKAEGDADAGRDFQGLHDSGASE